MTASLVVSCVQHQLRGGINSLAPSRSAPIQRNVRLKTTGWMQLAGNVLWKRWASGSAINHRKCDGGGKWRSGDCYSAHDTLNVCGEINGMACGALAWRGVAWRAIACADAVNWHHDAAEDCLHRHRHCHCHCHWHSLCFHFVAFHPVKWILSSTQCFVVWLA